MESTDFYGFGVPVRVTAPPASQVASESQLSTGTGAGDVGSPGISSGSSANPPKVTGTLTTAQADAAEQAVAAFWAALGRSNDPAAVEATVLPSQRSCVSSGLDGAPQVTVSGFRAIWAEPAGDGKATVRFTVNAKASLGGQTIPLPIPQGGTQWFLAAESAGHWYVDLSAKHGLPPSPGPAGHAAGWPRSRRSALVRALAWPGISTPATTAEPMSGQPHGRAGSAAVSALAMISLYSPSSTKPSAAVSVVYGRQVRLLSLSRL